MWHKQKELKPNLRNKHIKLAILVETKVKAHKALKVLANIVPRRISK